MAWLDPLSAIIGLVVGLLLGTLFAKIDIARGKKK